MKKVAILLIISVNLIACVRKVKELDSAIFLDFENTESADSLSYKFEGALIVDTFKCRGELVSDVFFGGKSAVKLANVSTPIELDILVHTDKIYKISYWRIGAANLNVELKGKDHSIRLRENVANRTLEGWEKIELLVNTVWCQNSSVLNIQIKQSQNKSTFIDDLKVEEITNNEVDFSLKLSNKSFSEVIKNRNKAYHSPYIRPEFKNKIAAELNGDEVTIKLKGDWTDHVSTGIWSFKTSGANSISKGAKTVTFQNLKTRNLLSEWVFINLCKKAGIVTPNYDIVTVSINDSEPYVCALEESFSDDFILRKRKYDAPVLRLYEDFLFPHWVRTWTDNTLKFPELENSYIYPYDDDKYQTEAHYPIFKEHGDKLLKLIKNDSIIDLIDIEKWAAFYAIQRLTHSYHNSTWHNTRWFVNAKGLIEPIAYDGNTQNRAAENWFGNSRFGELDTYLNIAPSVAINFMNKLFMNEVFMVAYKQELKKYSDPIFLKNELEGLSRELAIAKEKINRFYDYDFSTDYLFTFAEKLSKSIDQIDNSKWIGKEDIFTTSLKSGNIPKGKMYLKNLVRGYFSDGNILFVNGIKGAVVIRNKIETAELVIQENSKLVIKGNLNEVWVTDFEGEEIIIDIAPWIPLI